MLPGTARQIGSGWQLRSTAPQHVSEVISARLLKASFDATLAIHGNPLQAPASSAASSAGSTNSACAVLTPSVSMHAFPPHLREGVRVNLAAVQDEWVLPARGPRVQGHSCVVGSQLGARDCLLPGTGSAPAPAPCRPPRCPRQGTAQPWLSSAAHAQVPDGGAADATTHRSCTRAPGGWLMLT